MPIQNVANGWRRALDIFLSDHMAPMRAIPKRHFLLVIDFDNHMNRREDIVGQIPPDLVERFQQNAPLNQPNPATFYGGDEEGYTDYPALAQ